MSSVISLEEAARRTGLTKRQIGDKVAEGKLRIERDPVTGERGIYPHTLRGLNGYQPPEPAPPPRPQPPPPPKPEPWIPGHAEMAALIKLDGHARTARVAELVRQHSHLEEWFRKNLPPVFRKQEPPPQPQTKPPSPPPPTWQTSWEGTYQPWQTPPRQPDPPPVKPAPPEPPKRRQPPPFKSPPPRPTPQPQPSRKSAEPSQDLGDLLRLLLIALAERVSRPFTDLRNRLDHSTSERREKFREWVGKSEYARDFAKLWDNKAGRAIIVLACVYIAWRIL